MHVQTRPLHELFGAEIVGSNLAPCDAALTAAIETAIGEHGLLLFRDVDFDDVALARFTAGFGPLQNMSSKPGVFVEVGRVTNLTPEGEMLPAGDAMRRQQDANHLWHTDSTFWSPGATFSFLHAKTIPDEGGDTEFCDTRVAWAMLSPDRQAELAPLIADHSIFHSRRLIGFEMTNFSRSELPSIRRKLVRRHPPSGRNALIIPSHIEHIDGFDYEAGRALVDALVAIAAAPERVYRHRWQVGDLLMWDNRCMLHRATPFLQFEQPRDMRSCRVADIRDDG